MKTIATLALAGIALAAFLPAGSARADDCLLDTNNDGNADSNVDTDLAADSGGDDARLACGSGASAGSTGSVALGRNATTSSGGVANNIISSSINTAVGNSSFAIGSSNTALGAFARAATYDQSNADLGTVVGAIAVGNNALAGADATVAIGRNANSTGTSSTSVGAARSV